MKKFLIGLGITIVVVLFIILSVMWFISSAYNNSISLRNTATTQWSQVETQYQRRFDLVPNLAEATKGYLIHEQEVFKSIANARSKYGSAVSDIEKVNNIKVVESGLAKIMVAIENYPNLKANETVKALMDELAGTENRVNVARQRYNEAVLTYNNYIQMFPTNIIVGFFNFKDKELFENEVGAEKAVKINLDTKGLVK